MRSLSVTTPAATTPVTLTEAKLHLRVDGNTEDNLIAMLIEAATNLIESAYLWRSLVTRTYTLKDSVSSAKVYALSMPPVQSVTSVKVDGTITAAYTLDGTTGVLTFDSPVTGDIEIVYVAGYGNAAAVPSQFKQAILLLVGNWYENREAVTLGAQPAKVPYAIEALTLPFKARLP